jgi:AcrR family transcriptional regulator
LEPVSGSETEIVAGRPMRADARRNRQRVFDAAREMFSTGEGDPSMEQIARAAGVGIGTMYRNWPSRSALVEAIYREDLAGLTARAAQHHEQADPWDALVLWLRDYMDHARAKRGMLAELTAAFDARPELLTESRRQVVEATKVVLEPAQRAGVVRADLTAADLVQLVRGIVLSAIVPPDRDALLLDVVLDGLRI